MTRPELPSVEEYEARAKQLQATMKETELDGALLFQRVDVLYFSGTGQNAALFIPSTGTPLLMVRQSYERVQKERVAGRITRFRRIRDLSRILKDFGICDLARVGLELDVLPVLEYQKLKRSLDVREFLNISPLVLNLRMIKSPTEVKLMKQAARVVKMGHERAREILETDGVGIREIELAAEVEAAMRREGHDGLIHLRRWNQENFYGHILSGPNGALPSYVASPTGGQGTSIAVPQGAGNRKIQRNEPILVDIVGAYQGYYTDASRTYVIGQLHNSLLNAYQLTLQILKQAIKHIRIGTLSREVYQLALTMAREGGYEQGFMGCTNDRAPFLGHGIGMELDELPVLSKRSDTRLQKNMTLAIEPKIAIPKVGVVGVEDAYQLTDTGLKSLTQWENFLDIV
ncbi:MAG: M24 family metallopeptidase [Candidatus Heimdallarchaeota archaeon]